jgi:hypothetical protein
MRFLPKIDPWPFLDDLEAFMDKTVSFPMVLGDRVFPGSFRSITWHARTAYLGLSQGFLKTVDLSDPSSPKTIIPDCFYTLSPLKCATGEICPEETMLPGGILMKRFAFIFLTLFLFSCATSSPPPPPSCPECPPLIVYFSPQGGATEAIVKELENAKTSILVQAYSFTSAPIAKALVAAHERGVKVEILLDKSNLTAQFTSAPFVAKAGIPVKIDSAHDIAHNKIMIIDGEIVITGSFNFTKAAEDKNAENLLIIRNKATAEKYIKNWKEHERHSDIYQGK